jgi:hypothetical protein
MLRSVMPAVAAAVVIMPGLWLLFWIEAQNEKRQAAISRIAWRAVMALIGATAASVVASFCLDPDPLCLHMPQSYWDKPGWPCGFAQHVLRK